jgi:hypothetical protein
VERSLFLSAVEAALSLSGSAENGRASIAFARQAGMEWLARWPGDLRVRAHLASACIAAGETDAAIRHLVQVMEADPESVEPYRALSALYLAGGLKDRRLGMEACLAGLEASALPGGQLPQWADTLLAAERLLRSGRWQEARLAAETVMRAAPEYPLPALVQLKAALQLADYSFVISAGKACRSHWPGCTAFLLMVAQACFAAGQNAVGVEVLHAAAISDPASEVADRYLGSLNPYKPLWPARMETEIRIPVPGAVAFAAGWNKLASPPAAPGSPNLTDDIPLLKFPDFDSLNPDESPMARSDVIAPIPGEMYAGPSGSADGTAAEPIPEPAHTPSPAPAAGKTVEPGDPTLDDLREQLNRVAARLHMRKSFAHEDKRRPAYIMLTSRKRLSALYGAAPMGEVEQALQDLLRTKRAQRGWSAYLIDADNPESLEPFALTAVDPANAWQVKTLLAGLDGALARRGEMIAALLIVGGHEVIPFHLLPNPTDDDDREVPSDNPYSSRDENYFVPEWPVGRMPSPPDGNADFLLGMLRKAVESTAPATFGFWAKIVAFFSYLLRPSAMRFRNASGITAGVWQKASAEAYRGAGSSGGLQVCPPVTSKSLPVELFTRPKYSYFNLHGLENGPEWLGQSDPNSRTPVETEFPVALLPSQVAGNRPLPATVYTEACYGVNILNNKGTANAIALEFLAGGTRTLVGSTKISYGAAAAPLIAADLLGRLFLQNALQGSPAGEALQKAKLAFAEEMDRRQGFLDPEDQKTLISFVLLGDPLYVAEPAAAKRAKRGALRRRGPRRQINTFNAKADLQENGSVPSPQMQAALKKTMKRYLPGMDDSRMRYLHPRAEESGGGSGKEKPRRGKKPAAMPRTPAWVVALDRKYQAHGMEFTQYAKVSMDSAGHVVKIAVSR